jgi:hypothetical protein
MEQPEAMRTTRRSPRRLLAAFIVLDLVIAAVAGLWWLGVFQPRGPAEFDGERALQHVDAQMALGPRITGTDGHRAAGDYIQGQLQAAGWATEFQPFIYQDTAARNIIARANLGRGPIIIVGALRYAPPRRPGRRRPNCARAGGQRWRFGRRRAARAGPHAQPARH